MADISTMTFEEFQTLVNAMAQENKFTKPDDEVVIGVNDPSIAIKASVPVSMVYSGFDWEAGQVRIESPEIIYTLSYLKDMIPNIEEQLLKAHKDRSQQMLKQIEDAK